MSAKQLINNMAVKGYGIGRYKPGIYYYTWVETANNLVLTAEFRGTWQAWVKFCGELPSVK